MKEKLQPIQRVLRDYYYNLLYTNKLDNLEEIDEFLDTYHPPRLNGEEIENLNRLITSNEIQSVIKKTPNKQKSWIRRLHR